MGCGEDCFGRDGEVRPLSRRTLIGAAGAAGAGMVAGGFAPAGALAEPRAEAAKLSHREATRLIADVLSGRTVGDRHVVRLARHLSESDNGQAVVRRLKKMRNPVPRGAHALASGGPSDLGFTPPTNKISAHSFWWGYTVYFPHEWWMQLAQIIEGNLEPAEKIAELTSDLGELCEALEEICVFIGPLAAWLLANVAVMAGIDAKNHNGASCHATWPLPVVFIPDKF